jgi:hypothetical protein
MTRIQPALRRSAPTVVDEDRTMFDTLPWHLSAARRARPVLEDDDSITEVRPIVRPSVRRQAGADFAEVGSPVAEVLAPEPVEPAPELPAFPLALVRRRVPAARVSEVVESLSLPPGLREDMLEVGARPRDRDQVRIAIIRVAREVGREYRQQRGCVLRTDAAAIEVLQRHLLTCATEVLAGRMDARTMAPELARHGALFGEILARRLGGTWVDLSGDQPGAWQMSIPPQTVLSPIGRVHRFLLQRNREQDLVGHFLDLDAAARSAS